MKSWKPAMFIWLGLVLFALIPNAPKKAAPRMFVYVVERASGRVVEESSCLLSHPVRFETKRGNWAKWTDPNGKRHAVKLTQKLMLVRTRQALPRWYPAGKRGGK